MRGGPHALYQTFSQTLSNMSPTELMFPQSSFTTLGEQALYQTFSQTLIIVSPTELMFPQPCFTTLGEQALYQTLCQTFSQTLSIIRMLFWFKTNRLLQSAIPSLLPSGYDQPCSSIGHIFLARRCLYACDPAYLRPRCH